MPLIKLQLEPGIKRDMTPLSNKGGWYSCDKVRFRGVYPQKIGGWVRATTQQFLGTCRALISWRTLDSELLLGVGTHLRYYLLYGSVYYDITPIRATVTLGADPIATTSGSSSVVVTHTAHGASVGDVVILSGVGATIGGFTVDQLNTEHTITSVTSDNTYTIALVGTASSTATGGGAAVVAEYLLASGNSTYVGGAGWGASVWNAVATGVSTELTYTSGSGSVLLDASSTTINCTSTAGFTSTGRIRIEAELIDYSGLTATSFTGCTRGVGGSTAVSHAQEPVASPGAIAVEQVVAAYGATGWGETSSIGFGIGAQLRLWTHSNYGQDLVLAPRGGEVYYWAADTASMDRALTLRAVATALAVGDEEFIPTATNQVLVADTSRFVICLGANPYDPGDANTAFDPMLVRWSHLENPYVWVPAATNQAGEYRLGAGSYIMRGVVSRQEILIWTDSTLYSMQYAGPSSGVWGFTALADNLSLMGPNAVATANNTVFWMGTDKFYVYSGVVDTLPCDLLDEVFQDFNKDQAWQVFAGTNEGYDEVWWFYPSAQSTSIDRYVVYNHALGVWYYGTMDRTAWLDSPLWPSPLAVSGQQLLLHEQGVDDAATSAVQPIEAYIEASDFDIDEGDRLGFVRRILPDIDFSGSTTATPTARMDIRVRKFSGRDYRKTGGNGVTRSETVPVEQYTEQVFVRLRGRQMAFKVSSTAAGVAWRLGTPRADIRVDGKK